MWNAKKSIILSKTGVCIFVVLILGLDIFIPFGLKGFVEHYQFLNLKRSLKMVVFIYYLGSSLSLLLLINLYKLLYNIDKGLVFIDDNTRLLRLISWYCFAVAGVCFMGAFSYLLWFLFSVAAIFIGLIVRVVKNIIAEAITIKKESDLTI